MQTGCGKDETNDTGKNQIGQIPFTTWVYGSSMWTCLWASSKNVTYGGALRQGAASAVEIGQNHPVSFLPAEWLRRVDRIAADSIHGNGVIFNPSV